MATTPCETGVHRCRTVRASILLLLVFAVCTGSTGVAEKKINHPVRIRGVTVRAELSGRISVSGSFERGRITVKLLLIQNTPSQVVHAQSAVVEGADRRTSPSDVVTENGNRYAVFQLHEAGTYRYRLTATVETDQHPSNRRKRFEAVPRSKRMPYQQSTRHVNADHPDIRTHSKRLLSSGDFLTDLHRVCDWVHRYIQYDRQYYPETLDAVTVLRKKRGVCDEYSVLAGALLRAGGHAVRFVHGVAYSGRSWGNHSWMEVYRPGEGWLPTDPTYGEATVIDGTHIRRGQFADPSGNAVRVRTRTSGTVSTDIRVTEGEPNIKIRNTKPFRDLIEVRAQDVAFPAQTRVPLQIVVRNRTDGPLIIPVMLRKIRNLRIENRSRSALLRKDESRRLEWTIRMNRDLPKRKRLNGTYHVITMGEPIPRSMEVFSAASRRSPNGLTYAGGPPKSEENESPGSPSDDLETNGPVSSAAPDEKHDDREEASDRQFSLRRILTAYPNLPYLLLGFLGVVLGFAYVRGT